LIRRGNGSGATSPVGQNGSSPRASGSGTPGLRIGFRTQSGSPTSTNAAQK
jgi:hypothetical protein